MSESPGRYNVGDRSPEQRLTALEQRLERFDDVVAQRCLAVLDVADELNRQTNERLDRLATEVTQLAASVQQLIATSIVIEPSLCRISRIRCDLNRLRLKSLGENQVSLKNNKKMSHLHLRHFE